MKPGTKLAAEAINKHRLGEPLEDEDIRTVRRVLPDIIDFLGEVGERYALVRLDLLRELDRFDSYWDARKGRRR